MEDLQVRLEESTRFASYLDKPLARSLLQKAVRRGDIGYALSAAMTLWTNAPHLLARSLLSIALEEVGLADLSLVGRVLSLVSSGIRSLSWPEIAEITQELVAAPKCQAAADLMTIARSSSRVTQTRKSCAGLGSRARIDLAVSRALSLEERAVSVRFLASGQRDSDVARATRKTAQAFFARIAPTAPNQAALEIAQRAYACNRPGAALGLALLSTLSEDQSKSASAEENVHGASCEIAGIPSLAFDSHTLLGAWALTLAAKNDAEIKAWLKRGVRWWEDNIEALAFLLFVVEGKPVLRRQSSAYGIVLHEHATSSRACIRRDELQRGIELMRSKVSAIDAYRRSAFEMSLAGQR